MGENFLLTSGSAAVISALFIQYLKKSKFLTFLSIEAQSERTNRYFSIIVAFIASVGVTYTFDPNKHQLIISGLDPTNILHSGGHVFIQWIAQHVAYKTVVVPTELQAAMVNTMKQLITHMDEKK